MPVGGRVTRLYIIAAGVAIVIAGAAFLRYDAVQDDRLDRELQNQASDRAAIERVNDAIRRNDNATDALERLRERNEAR